ncbi:MAG TPA: RagB/SusD family nutrient uptake outer membrane protein [Puia sp.]|nr:RagB/SusD family nutrient uptake outer membrane protein [Puia sp.]
MTYRRYIAGSLFVALLCAGCRKFTETPAEQQLMTPSRVFSDDADAEAAMAGVYIDMAYGTRGFMNGAISLDAGLSADELDCRPQSLLPPEDSFRRNILSPGDGLPTALFDNGYLLVNELNSVIEGVRASASLSPAVQDRLEGEAEFGRAFVYFYLVNLYGAVPLALGTDLLQNERLGRASVDSVYAQVTADLEDAQRLLPVDYFDAPGYEGDRTRPNRATATAMLARVRLYRGQWDLADSAASVLINDPRYLLEPSLDSVFLSGSREAIWQLQPVLKNFATADAFYYLLPPGRPNFILTPDLMGAFETGDQRESHWTKGVTGTTYFIPTKYRQTNPSAGAKEYEMVLRLAEQYVIRAEARARVGNLAGAVADVNSVRTRAGLPGTSATGTAAVLAAVLQERRVELMTEWGHRWLDLKRTVMADSTLVPEKPWWQTTDQLYPIPDAQLRSSPGMQQNPGYQ